MKDKIRQLWDRLTGKTKRDQQNRQAALAGTKSSGYLLPGERDRLFRQRRRR